MRGFVIVWLGQVVSMLGTGMTNFAIAVWIFQQTGSASSLTGAMFFFMVPAIFFSPIAGALVDRYDRKKIMILSDLIAGLATILLLLLLWGDQLAIWHIYLANFIAGAANSFQFPAYSAAVSMMLRKEDYGRAAGMLSLAGAASGILAPMFAGALLGIVGLVGIMAIDLVTFVVAVGALFIVFIPAPQKSADGERAQSSLWSESFFGFKYIFARPSLLGLQLVFLIINFVAMFGFAVMVPMILSRTGNNELQLAAVQSVGAVGGVVGGLLLSIWGGPRRKVDGVLLGMIGVGIFGQILMGVGRGLVLWSVAAFLGQFILPILNGSSQAIWQAKVAPDVQGRVFAARRLIAQVVAPIATLVAGPLADRFFEPGMLPGGRLADAFSGLVGAGPGSGMGLMFVLSGCLAILVGAGGYLFPAVRNAEQILPDFALVQQAEQMRRRVEELGARLMALRHNGQQMEYTEELLQITQELRQIGRDYPLTAVPHQ
jgi:DHA3 family macrolide efflux protein-like MFS transporter